MQAQEVVEQVRGMLSRKLYKDKKLIKWMNKVDKDENNTICANEWNRLLLKIKKRDLDNDSFELTPLAASLTFKLALQSDPNRTANNELTFAGLKEWVFGSSKLNAGQPSLQHNQNLTLVHPVVVGVLVPVPATMSRQELTSWGRAEKEPVQEAAIPPMWWKCPRCDRMNGNGRVRIYKCTHCGKKYEENFYSNDGAVDTVFYGSYAAQVVVVVVVVDMGELLLRKVTVTAVVVLESVAVNFVKYVALVMMIR